jgi:hypothetical protein
MRQRVLARAAVQALTDPEQPLVVVLPPQWRPGTQAGRSGFFTGLRVPWLRAVRLDTLPLDPTPVVSAPSDEEADGTAETDEDGGSEDPSETAPAEGTPDTGAIRSALALRYPQSQVARELPRGVFRAARRLTRTGAVLGGLVVDADVLAPRVTRQALLGLSFNVRGRPAAARARLRGADNVLRAQVRDVEVLAPRFVRMSSESGSFLVPVVNGLQVPVQVQLRPVVAEPGLTLEVPDPVVVEPETRQPIRVAVQSESIGVRSVRVDLVTPAGDRLYVGPKFAVRSNQVARWVWVAMGAGSAVLLVTIVVRIVRRVRSRKATHGPVLARSKG